MKRNMGTLDRAIRFFVAIGIGILCLMDGISGNVAIFFGLLVLILVIISLIGFCPLDVPQKISTLKKR